MPSPVQITNTAKMPSPLYNPGPHASGSKIHVVLQDRANNNAEIWQSTDSGATWAEVDSGSHAAFNGSSFVLDTFRRDDILHVSGIANGGTSISVTQFDIGSGTWGSSVTGGPVPDTARQFKCAVRAGGDIVSVFQAIQGGAIGIGRQVYSGGSWGSTAWVFEPGVTDTIANDYFIKTIVMDSTGAVLIAATYVSGSKIRLCTIATDNSIGAVTKLEFQTPFIEDEHCGQGRAFSICGSLLTYLPLAARAGADLSGVIESAFPAFLIVGVDIANVIGSPFSFIADALGNSTIFTSSVVQLASGGPIFLYFSEMTNVAGPDVQYKIRRACYKGAGISSTPIDVLFPAAGYNEQCSFVSAEAVGSDIGILFCSSVGGGSTYSWPQFLLDSAPICSSPGCSSSTQRGGAV